MQKKNLESYTIYLLYLFFLKLQDLEFYPEHFIIKIRTLYFNIWARPACLNFWYSI